jgi:hypothetical protein
MVTFETKVYEKDWRYILNGNYLDKVIRRCQYPFAERVLLINNVSNREAVIEKAEKKIRSGTLDRYYLVDRYAEETLDFFHIDKTSFQGGYYYSIAELVSIYLCRTEFLLHFSSDAFMGKVGQPWIESSKEILRSHGNVLVANPCWDYRFDQARREALDETDGFFKGFGFSDQCYLIQAERFRKDMFNETHPHSGRYPVYGGELFEKRVDSYMRNHQLMRITAKHASYIHKNFSRHPLLYRIDLLAQLLASLRLRNDAGRRPENNR